MKADEVHFSLEVEGIMEKFFSAHSTTDAEFQRFLIQTIVDCYHIPSKKITRETKSILIIHHLLKKIIPSFDFAEFIKIWGLKKKERKAFLIAFIHGLYYGDIILGKLRGQTPLDLECFLLQIAAENISKKTVFSLLKSLTLSDQVKLIYYLHKYYREGSFSLLLQLEKIYPENSQSIQRLMYFLKRKYFDINKLKEILDNQTKIDEKALLDIVQKLEEFANSQVAQCWTLLSEIIPLVIQSPLFMYNEIERIKALLAGNVYRPDPEEQKKGKALSQENEEKLRQLFASFFTYSFDLKRLSEVFQSLGLYDHAPLLPHQTSYCQDNTLIEKLQMILQIFSDSSLMLELNPFHVEIYIVFLHTLVEHIVTLNYPDKYVDELHRFTFALPTAGKLLDDLPGLISVVKGFSHLFEIICTNSTKKIYLKDYPLFVFDQSEAALFKKNAHYIRTLNRKYRCSIVHLSKKSTLELAQKLEVENLINTTKTGSFGYGGMRNAVFLLTPILKHIFSSKKSIKQMLQTSPEILNPLFNRYEFGGVAYEIPSGDTIFMIDDDMEIAEGNIFSHLIFSKSSTKQINLNSVGFNIGRETKHAHEYPSLAQVIHRPDETYKFNQWSTEIMPSALSEYICNPKICFNLPLGAEEILINNLIISNLFLGTSYHLGGNRLPKHLWPTHYLVGLEQHLRRYITFVIYIFMIESLAPPNSDINSRNIYPWIIQGEQLNIVCLREGFEIIANVDIQLEMQRRFWRNFHLLFTPEQTEKMNLRNYLKDIIETPIDDILQKTLRASKFDTLEKKSIHEIGEIYKFYQQDATYLWEFGTSLLKINDKSQIAEEIERIKDQIEKKYHIQFKDLPLTYGLYLMTRAFGAGEFNQEIQKILKKNENI